MKTVELRKENIKEIITKAKNSSFIKDYPSLELSVGHVPSYDEEQESEIPKNWYEPLKD